jgi:tRNA A-37 threonylcarbamoyl transferase component Bud32
MKPIVSEAVIWGNCDNRSEHLLTQHKMKSAGQNLTIFSLGDTNLGELLMRCPDLFNQPECKIIKHEKKIRVGYVPLPIRGTIQTVYIKQHNCLSLAHRVGSLFFASAATRSLCGAAILLQEGHATARPVAAMEYRLWGILTKSLYISEEISGTKTVETYWRENLIPLKGMRGYLERRAFLKSLGHKFNSLHRKKIYHNDLKASNILVRNTDGSTADPFTLIDPQGLRKCFYLSKRRKIKNLAQLNRTLGLFLTKTEKLFLLKAYGDLYVSNPTKKRKLIKTILNETIRQAVREKSGLTGKHLFHYRHLRNKISLRADHRLHATDEL